MSLGLHCERPRRHSGGAAACPLTKPARGHTRVSRRGPFEDGEPHVFYAEDSEKAEEIEKEAEIASGVGLPANLTDEVPLPFEVAAAAMSFDDQAQFHPGRYLAILRRHIENVEVRRAPREPPRGVDRRVGLLGTGVASSRRFGRRSRAPRPANAVPPAKPPGARASASAFGHECGCD